jgi:hypothetical protein
MLEVRFDSNREGRQMTTLNFDKMPTQTEAIDLTDISPESVKQAWKDYEAKPEYKDFNKHDLIESMQVLDEENKKALD